MGTRSMNALMVKAHHKPTTEAAAHFKDVATVVEMKGLGTAWVWETNTQPLWARSSDLAPSVSPPLSLAVATRSPLAGTLASS